MFKKLMTPELKKKILVIILILLSLNGLIFISKFIGYVSYHEADAGTITEIDIKYSEPAYNWAGLYGVTLPAEGYNNTQWINLEPADMEEKNLIFPCFPYEEKFIFASMIESNLIDWSTIQAGTPEDIDNYLGINNSEMSSAANTFTDTIIVHIGTTSIVAPAVYTNVYGMEANKTFGVGVLIDISGNLVFAANVADFTTGFIPSNIHNYQMILPIANLSEQEYFFTVNPLNVECPSGEGIAGESGFIEGYVTDGTTGIPLEDAFVTVCQYWTATNNVGYYHLNVPAGNGTLNLTISSGKEGYENYIGDVTVYAENTTLHNIALNLKNEFTGPGQTDFTNVDVGPNDKDDVGPGIGPGIGPYLEEPKNIEGQDFVISIPKINRRLKKDNYLEEIISLYSFKDEAVTLEFKIEGNVKDLIEIEKDKMLLPGKSNDELKLRIFGRGPLGIYNGSLIISGSINEEVPIRIELTDKELLDIQTLFIDLEPVEQKVNPGDVFQYKTTLRNLLTDKSYPVHLFYTITDRSGKNVISVRTENINLKTTFSLLKSEKLSKNIKPGDYILTLQATYLDLTSTVSTIFKVALPFYKYMVFGKVPLWWIMIGILFLLILTGLGYWYYQNLQSKKKYHLKVDYKELPKPGPRNVYVGKIAETEHKTYFNLENFKVHTIVAGSTGGGKSFAAQGIIEEMLLKNVAVILFDPTAQWTGMLRKLTSKSILSLYPIFGMKQNEAKAFNGNIRQINDARELLNIKKYMKPGEIQIFACHKLDPKDMDIYVANAIREVFHSNFDESRELRLMLVFDEVHRLLPKFGGSGEGFLQIERGCREFRKWGIGIMLISQVLSDFVGQIKANINTEIQMRTRDEGDLDRISTRYGKDMLQSLVKATVGTGMIENPAYNRGKPYFISFKPIRHSVERLTDDEILKYNTYNEDIDQLFYELEILEHNEDLDIFDLKLELKLALDKVKSGNFNMVDIYLEGIWPRILKLWKKLGKTAPRLEKRLVDEKELRAEIKKAKEERKKAEAEENKNTPITDTEKVKGEKEKTSFDLKTEFKEALNFSNGAQVTTLQELADVLPTMDANIFFKSVNDEKNDVENWIRDKLKVPSLADKLKEIKNRNSTIKIIEEELKNPTKIKENPEESPKKEEIDNKKEVKSLDNDDNISKKEKKMENNVKEKKAEPVKKEELPQDAKKDKNLEPQTKKKLVWQDIKKHYLSLNLPEEKIGYLLEKENESPNEANIKYAIALEYHKKKDYLKAKEKYEHTLKLLPDNAKIKHHLNIINKIIENDKSKDNNIPNKTIEKEVPKEKYFRLGNGTELKSYMDLKDAIKKMNDDEIKTYVNEERNDFANWVEYVLENKGLAKKLRDAHNKSELEAALT